MKKKKKKKYVGFFSLWQVLGSDELFHQYPIPSLVYLKSLFSVQQTQVMWLLYTDD